MAETDPAVVDTTTLNKEFEEMGLDP